MSEELTVEEHVNAMAQARSPEAPADNAGTAAKPEAGENTADPDQEVPEGEETESEELDDAEGEEQEASGEDDSEDEEDKPKRKPSRAQKRIRKLVREKGEVERRLEQREAELRVLLQRMDGQKPDGQAQQQDQDPKPQQEKYDDYSKYLEDIAAWSGRQEARKSLQAERQAVQKAQAETRQQKAEAARVEGATAIFDKGAEAYEDFQEVASTDMPVTDAMTDAIMDMEDGHEVLYYLGQNPEEAERIAELRPVSQVRELTKLEAKLTGPKPKTAPKPKKTTSATEPIKPVKGGGGARKVEPDEMSMKEYMQNHSARVKRGEIPA